MRDAARTRTAGVTLATIALAAATVYSGKHAPLYAPKPVHLAKSLEASVGDWTDGIQVCPMRSPAVPRAPAAR